MTAQIDMDRGGSWDAGALSSYGGRQHLRSISMQLQDIQSTVEKCLQEVSRTGRESEESEGVKGAIECGMHVTEEMMERGTIVLQDAQSSLETFLSLLQPQKVTSNLFDADLATVIYSYSVPEPGTMYS